MAYNNWDVGMNLKYAKSERAGHGRVLGWSLQNGVAYVELYFPDVVGVVYVGPAEGLSLIHI